MDKRRIGIFGGTFDPPHNGHLAVIEGVLKSALVDEIWILVAPEPWQKADRPVTAYTQRLAMVELGLIEGVDNVRLNEVENSLDGPTSTYKTLTELTRLDPDIDFVPIIGSDTAAGLESWHNASELKASYCFIVVNRPGVGSPVPDGWQYEPIEIAPVDVSSSQIRQMTLARADVLGVMPGKVASYVAENNLYVPAD